MGFQGFALWGRMEMALVMSIECSDLTGGLQVTITVSFVSLQYFYFISLLFLPYTLVEPLSVKFSLYLWGPHRRIS